MVKGLFITFEGVDGCGKSTQADRLAATLAERGVDVLRTREPGGTPLGQELRTLMLASGDDGPVPVAEMLLMAADRAQHVREVVRPGLQRGAVVVSDRFIDSSIAYQAGGLQLPEEDVLRVNLVATAGLWPHKTIWLDIDPRVGLERIGGRGAEEDGVTAKSGKGPARGFDRIEERGLDFQRRVLRTYERLAEGDPERWVRIDVTGLSVDEVAAAVWTVVEPLVQEAGWTE